MFAYALLQSYHLITDGSSGTTYSYVHINAQRTLYFEGYVAARAHSTHSIFFCLMSVIAQPNLLLVCRLGINEHEPYVMCLSASGGVDPQQRCNKNKIHAYAAAYMYVCMYNSEAMRLSFG